MKNRACLNLVVTAAMAATALVNGCGYPEDEGVHRIAVVVDQTGSFKPHLLDAARLVKGFIRENALQGEAEVYLIVLDRAPRAAKRFGSAELLNKTDQELLDSMSEPTDLDGTDVVTALKEALARLQADNGTEVSRRSMLVFSDMIVDRQTQPVMVFRPLEEFSWNELRGVDCRFYFVDTKLRTTVTSLVTAAGAKALVLDAVDSEKVKISEIAGEEEL